MKYPDNKNLHKVLAVLLAELEEVNQALESMPYFDKLTDEDLERMAEEAGNPNQDLIPNYKEIKRSR